MALSSANGSYTRLWTSEIGEECDNWDIETLESTWAKMGITGRSVSMQWIKHMYHLLLSRHNNWKNEKTLLNRLPNINQQIMYANYKQRLMHLHILLCIYKYKRFCLSLFTFLLAYLAVSFPHLKESWVCGASTHILMHPSTLDGWCDQYGCLDFNSWLP